VIDRKDWISAYKTHRDRVLHYDDLARELDAIFKTRNRDHWMTLLEGEGVPFAPELEVQEVENDPQVKHLDVFYSTHHPAYGEVKFARRPITVDSNRTIDLRPPPALGEHTEAILTEAGLTPAEVRDLREAKIIAQFEATAKPIG
jgi:crotonobetainyl-CoA:carnitine CoA-transferase CaiB-like acyl-CoA transferase